MSPPATPGNASVHPYRTRTNELAWRVRWREKGRLLSKSFSTEGQAKTYARQVGTGLKVLSVLQSHTIEAGKLSELITRYVAMLTMRSKPDSQHPRAVAHELIGACRRMGWTLTTDLNEAGFDALIDSFGQRRRHAQKTIIDLKSFVRWLDRNRIAVDTQLIHYKTPKHTAKESVSWSEEEVALLTDELLRPNDAHLLPDATGTGRRSPESRARGAATTAYQCRQAAFAPFILMVRWAPRPKETCSLRVVDWNVRTGRLTLPATITKNGRKRSFAIDDYTADLLTIAAQGRAPQEPLFLNRFGIGWTADALENILTKAIKAVGLEGTPYSTRHTACTRICRLANGDIPTIQSITGHLTLSELARYLHTTSARQRVIADAYNAVPALSSTLRIVESGTKA